MKSIKDPMSWAFYSRKLDDVTILVHRSEDAWDVYYRRPKYPFAFAFGLPLAHDIEYVFDVAERNIDNYIDMLYGF